ncbi:MAG: NAD(P)H-hydrate dehydratase [Clostridia bacterium]|nr:NAD(P)H-hydrate dehydratase [Clostridia bacterium]
MKEIVSVELMRKSDFATIDGGVSGAVLMHRAAMGVYNSVSWYGKIGIVCGSGNNAGDGYALALILKEKGIECDIILVSNDKFSNDGKYYFNKCLEVNIPTLPWIKCNFSSYDILVDCILGTGFAGEPRGDCAAVIDKVNESDAYIVSVDINSGLNGDNGMAKKAVKSHLTVSIGTEKAGHHLGMARDYIGSLTNCDIGIEITDKPYYLIEMSDCVSVFKERRSFSNKGNYGYSALIGGCMEYSGAVKLANLALSALKSGTGVVKLATAKSLFPSVSPYLLESTFYPLTDVDGSIIFDPTEIDGLLRGVKVVAVGMGIGNTENVHKILVHILKNYAITVIIDADGLNALARYGMKILKETKCNVVLTPHPKEMERLSGIWIDDILSNPINAAFSFAKEYACTILLKGSGTVVSDGKDIYISDTGCSGMATAGSGDVLCGVLLGILSQIPDNISIPLAVASGAYINGLAGEFAEKDTNPVSMTSGDTVKAISTAISEILKN